MNTERIATGGAIGLSFLVASCCLGPTLLLFGISAGALGALSVLEPYRSIFVVAAVAALAIGGVRIFRSAGPNVECDGDTCAPDARSRQVTRGLFYIAAALLVVATVYPYVLNTLL
jgi:mercuric ion transport protein